MRNTYHGKVLQQFLRMIGMTRQYWPQVVSIMAAAFVIQFLSMLVPYFSQMLIDKAYPSHNYRFMEVLVIAIIAANVFSVLLRHSRVYFNVRTSAMLNNSMSLLFFNHIQHLRTRFFDQRRTGEIISRFQDLSSSIRSVTNALQVIVMQGIYLVLVPPVLFIISRKLALLALLTVPIMFAITYHLGRVSRPYLKKTSESYAELRGFQTEVLQNIKALKSMALERHNYEVADGLMQSALSVQIQASRIGSIYGAFNGLIRTAGTALYTWLGWKMILTGEISLGQFIAFTTYAGYVYQPISELVSTYSDLQQSSVSFDRMFEYLDEVPEESAKSFADRDAGPPLHGDIDLVNATFGYSEGHAVLKGVNACFRRGSVKAIMGPSGCGKTSLLRLLVALDQPDSGKVLYDGMPVRHFGLANLRRQIAVVWQESSLIRGSIRDNLLLGAPCADDERLRRIVRICCLEELLESLPQKLDTMVSEKGSTLSAGQCQRIAIARALMRETPVLILDEATANIDVETESRIMRAILSEFNDKTIILVSHRYSTISMADAIYVMGSGTIVASVVPADLQTQGELQSSITDCAPFAGYEKGRHVCYHKLIRSQPERGCDCLHDHYRVLGFCGLQDSDS